MLFLSPSEERIKAIYHNIPRMFFELANMNSLKAVYLYYYFNLPYLFPLEKFPSKVAIELTNKCNFSCTHCHRVYANKNRTQGEMDFQLLKKIVDEVAQYRGSILKIGGWGEPSLHSFFKEILQYCTKKGVRTFIFTNGTFFRQLSFQEILSWSNTVIEFSIDGLDEESYLKIRKGGNFRFLKDNIRELFWERDKMKQKYPRIVVQHVVFPKESSEQLWSFRKTWMDIADAVDYCQYNPIEYFLEERSKSENLKKRCKRVRRELSIFYDGRVPVCGPQVKHNECEWLGEVQKKTIFELWNKSRFGQIRKLLKKRELDTLPACRECIYFR